jgi:hypothetical protein
MHETPLEETGLTYLPFFSLCPQTPRQNRKGHHGLREQDGQEMGWQHRRIQELSPKEDGVNGSGVGLSVRNECVRGFWRGVTFGTS